MALEALREVAAAEVRLLVDDAARGFPAAEWVWQALQTPGKLLGPQHPFCWGLLPPLACQATGGDSRQALPLSAAVECAIAAADVLDDVEDQDAADALWRRCGIPTATNIGNLLLFLSQIAIARLVDNGVPSEKVVEVVQTFATAGATACSGQQRDLQSATSEADESEYLARIAEKSASLARCACRSGAVVGAASPSGVESAIEPLSEFGFDVGMALQITNDLVGISPDGADRGDLRTGKRTLPIVYALRYAPDAIRAELAGALEAGGKACLDARQVDHVRDLVTASGALDYTTVIADVYWERAQSSLEQVEGNRAGDLMDLLARMRSSWRR